MREPAAIAIIFLGALLLIGVASAGSFTEHDVGLVPNYTLTLNIFDASTGAPIIASVSVVTTGADMNTYTTSTGSVNISSAYGLLYVTAASSGYITGTDSWLMDRDRTETISLYTASPTQGQQIFTSPHNVKFFVRTVLGTPVINATVNATYVESSGPLDWLFNWLGVPTSSGVDVQNTTLSGHTGLDGSITFTMVEVVQYNVEAFSDYGDASMKIYPKDDEYTIWLGNLSGAQFFEHGANPLDVVRVNVTAYEHNSTAGRVDVVYSDSLNQTVTCAVFINQSHSYGNVTNETKVGDYTYPGGIPSRFTYTLDILNSRDQSYLAHVNCTHTTFGLVERDFGWTFPPGPTSFGIPENLLVYVGMVGLIFIALCFTRTLPGPAAIAIMFFAWVFYFWRWWRDLAPELIVVAALVAFSALAVFYNIMLRSKKVIYD